MLNTFDKLRKLYKTYGAQPYFGEDISQITHAEQCAYFAKEAGYDNDIILAALLHDIGHIVDPNLPQMNGDLGTQNHEIIGSNYLKSIGFPLKICELVKRHVDAKRYLCYKDSSYYNKLSLASKETLKQQGGPMKEEEANNFENNDPLFNTIISLRIWDEKAKLIDPPFNIPKFDDYKSIIESVILNEKENKNKNKNNNKIYKHYTLSLKQLEIWDKNGFILLKDLLSSEMKLNIIQWCSDIQNWTPTKGKWMVYYEKSNITGNEILCRTENFLPYHKPLNSLLSNDSCITDVLEQLFNEKPVVFKEKFNYKQAGASGFPAHQDAPAFSTFKQQNHLSLSIAIDSATPENGCLEVSPGNHIHGLYPQTHHGGLNKESEDKLNWIPVLMDPGDVLIFSSWLPHRSGPNTTNSPRRVLYVTYNGENDGDYRNEYYIDKLKNFPQKVDRIPGKDYSVGAKTYNLATPIIN